MLKEYVTTITINYNIAGLLFEIGVIIVAFLIARYISNKLFK